MAAWYVLYTKPRNEKKIALLLQQKNINTYCPVQEVVKQWSDRKKKISEPVFKSYVFVELNDYTKDSIEVLNTRGSVRFLWWLGKPAIVRDEEIETIKNFLNKYRCVEVNNNINTGQEVYITEGVFKDKKGTVVQLRGKTAILHIDSLGWNISAHIDLQSLMPAK